MKNNNFKKIEMMSETDLLDEQAHWTGQQWHDYFTQEGEMSIDEFKKLAKEKVLKKWEEKYGNNA